MTLAGCQTPQRFLSEDELVARKPAELRAAQAEIDRIDLTSGRRLEQEVRDAQRAGAARQSFDVLVLSGGGAMSNSTSPLPG